MCVMSKRVSLILKPDDEAALEPYLSAKGSHSLAVRRWGAERGLAVNSEAATLRVLLRAGVEALQDEALEAGYADLATEFNSAELASERRAHRSRYADHTDSQM